MPEVLKEQYLSLNAFINNHCKRINKNIFYQVGYEALGPLFKGFVEWLQKELHLNNIQKCYFLARDGKIMQRAYKLLPIEEQVDTQYMYASRRMLIVPTLWMCESLNEVVSSMFLPKSGTIGAFIKKIGLNEIEYLEQLKSYGYGVDEIYIYEKLFENKNFKDFFEVIKRDMYQNSKSEFDAYVSYLKEIGFAGKVAVVDIGWHGNMQKALKKLCAVAGIDVDIYGYYLGLNPNINNKLVSINVKAFLFDGQNNQIYYKYRCNFTNLFELLLTADHGSCEKFSYNSDKYGVVLKPFEYINSDGKCAYEYESIKSIQEGAIDFLMAVNCEKQFIINWHPNLAFQNLLLLGINPNQELAYRFGDLRMMDDELLYLARPNQLISYMINPSRYFTDLRSALWKVGFKKRLFKINFKYYKYKFEKIFRIRS